MLLISQAQVSCVKSPSGIFFPLAKDLHRCFASNSMPSEEFVQTENELLSEVPADSALSSIVLHRK